MVYRMVSTASSPELG